MPKEAATLSKSPRVNLRTPAVMAAVQAQVESHYRSEVVERLRAAGGTLSAGQVTVKLAKQFGFCYGVERAIDLAYAAAKVFTDRRLFILGEIIHNPEVNDQIRALGIKNLIGQNAEARVDDLTASDVVIVPAFGTDVTTLARIKEIGSNIVDTTCGDVMSVWKRVRQNAQDDMTSVIHGKASHEETKAITSSSSPSKTPTTSATTSATAETKTNSSRNSAAPTATASTPTSTSAASASPTRPP